MRPPPPAVLLPDLEGRSLHRVVPAVNAALGIDPAAAGVDADARALLDLPTSQRYVVVLVDGLGHDLLEEHADLAPYLATLLGRAPLRCGAPSTTATSLTSLGTGLTAGTHGVVGYTSRIPGTLKVLNSLTWDRSVDAREWQPHPSAFSLARDAGVAVTCVNKASFEDTGLTVCSQRGVPFVGIGSVWERLEAVVEASAEGERSLVYAYESTLDHTGHDKGCTSAEWRDRLRSIDADLAELREALPPGTTMVVTADHGMLDLPHDDRFDADEHPALLQDVVLLAGEARFRHLYTRGDTAAAVARRWQEQLGDAAWVLTRDEAEELGLFGRVDPTVRPRIGDVLVASLGDHGVFSSRRWPHEAKMAGFHGSLSGTEMRVPLLVDAG